jgi:hypothetical protein
MDEAIGRMPDAPHAHLPLTVRTAQGVSPAALLIALAVGPGGNDLDRPPDDARDPGQGIMNHALDLRKRLGGLHPVIPDALEALRKHVRHHASDKRVDFYRFPLDSLALVRTIMIRDLVPIVGIETPE